MTNSVGGMLGVSKNTVVLYRACNVFVDDLHISQLF